MLIVVLELIDKLLVYREKLKHDRKKSSRLIDRLFHFQGILKGLGEVTFVNSDPEITSLLKEMQKLVNESAAVIQEHQGRTIVDRAMKRGEYRRQLEDKHARLDHMHLVINTQLTRCGVESIHTRLRAREEEVNDQLADLAELVKQSQRAVKDRKVTDSVKSELQELIPELTTDLEKVRTQSILLQKEEEKDHVPGSALPEIPPSALTPSPFDHDAIISSAVFIDDGAFGLVYRAKYTKPGGKKRTVAVKVLLKQHMRRAREVLRFRREMDLIADIRDHYVVSAFGGFRGDEGELQPPYMVMELLGSNLRLWINKQRQRTDASDEEILCKAVKLGLDTTHGLAALHREGVLHRDLKTLNVLIEPRSGLAKLTDFGLAEDGTTSSGDGGSRYAQSRSIRGTVMYMAPEVFRGLYSTAGDIYALGVVLWELVSLERPFDQMGDVEIQTRVCNNKHDWETALYCPDDELVKLIDDCLSYAPSRRPTAHTVVRRLTAIYTRLSSSTADQLKIARLQIKEKKQKEQEREKELAAARAAEEAMRLKIVRMSAALEEEKKRTAKICSECNNPFEGDQCGRCSQRGSASSDSVDTVRSGVEVYKTVNIFGRSIRTDVTTLSLNGNQIVDVSPLASLTRLTELHLEWNQIVDVSPLASLTRLTKLHLERNKIVDVSPLASLTQLTKLALSGNQIVDVSPLASLTQLKDLWLYDNQIVDVSPLASLTQLTELRLYDNQIVDVSPLASITQLTELSLYGNQIVDVSPLASLTTTIKKRPGPPLLPDRGRFSAGFAHNNNGPPLTANNSCDSDP